MLKKVTEYHCGITLYHCGITLEFLLSHTATHRHKLCNNNSWRGNWFCTHAPCTNQSSGLRETVKQSYPGKESPPGGGAGVLPYMGYIVMCRCEGYGFQAVYSRIGYINQSVWVYKRVSFFRKLISWLNILSRLRILVQGFVLARLC